MALQQSDTADKIIGALLIIILVVSLVGNISALRFFWSNKRKTLPDKLYITIAVVDIITSISSVPVITSLLNNRKAMICGIPALCSTYLMTVLFSVRMSIFLVAVLSVTRTVAIVSPHRFIQIKTELVTFVIGGYVAFLIFTDIVFLAQGWFKPVYLQLVSACVLSFTDKSPSWASNFYYITFDTEFAVPSIIVFVSFIVGIVALMRKKAAPTSNIDVPSFQNAALNPCLYLIRMPQYKHQIKERISVSTKWVSSRWNTIGNASEDSIGSDPQQALEEN